MTPAKKPFADHIVPLLSKSLGGGSTRRVFQLD